MEKILRNLILKQNQKTDSKSFWYTFIGYITFFASYAQVSLNGLTSQYQKRGKKYRKFSLPKKRF